ncbi:hypothetical protein O6H91_19G035500 [Diphasiastrum complanatum]|uniref:Uncharacterized protein n=2 Tax=Diphasiastrum complanatum TaxID=34168 RepID=A0ACC2AU15_DIPCM|nr:hypothetical protein O6H91_19G035500 [Diphasiastrum complanatum]KAJ7521051.1 hypothetical protein O6H91_19G035500 [Diphasiastrum complanatum]
MGTSRRWLLGLIGSKKASKSSRKEEFALNENGKEEKKKASKEIWRHSFGKSFDYQAFVAEENRQSHAENNVLVSMEQEQAKHVIEVATAEAAVASAQAAAPVPKFNRNGLSFYCQQASEMDEWAALKIQTAFRVYLARRALRALKGVVRLQALFRGQRVRKQAALTLRCMHALVRLQAQIRAHRVRMSEEGQAVQQHRLSRSRQQPEPRPRKFMEERNANPSSLEDLHAKTEQRQREIIHEPDTPHLGWSWLERRITGRPWESPVMDTEKREFQCSPREWNSQESKKIVEIDSSKDLDKKISEAYDKMSADCKTRTQMWSYPTATVIQSFPSSPGPNLATSTHFSHLSQLPISVKSEHSDDKLGMQVDGLSTSYAELLQKKKEHDLIRANSSSAGSITGPKSAFKSGKSEIGRGNQPRNGMGVPVGFPGYMSPTQSATAKVRSRSTPKLRPKTSEQSSYTPAKRLSLPAPNKKICPALVKPSVQTSDKSFISSKTTSQC